MEKIRAPYGSWPSPLSAATVAEVGEAVFNYGGVDIDERAVSWVESRPGERGRSVVVRRERGAGPVDVTPPGSNVRTRVHEYGGGAFFRSGETFFFSEFADGRLYRQEGIGVEPRPITPEPSAPSALRYADGRVSPDGATIVCVRESHEGGDVRNELVALPTDGSHEPVAIVSGNDFYASPRVSRDGRELAWTTWNHPLMPFDGCELWVGELANGGVRNERLVAGGPRESIFQPEWGPDGALYFSSDRTGWWNLHRTTGDGVEALAPVDGEIGTPQWLFGFARYAFLPDGRIACLVTRNAVTRLEVLDPRTGEYDDLDLPFTYYAAFFAAHGNRLGAIAASPTESLQVVEVDVATGEVTPLSEPPALLRDEEISRAEAIEFPTAGGATAHAFYYPPASATHEAPGDDLPPLRVFCHGGPTAAVPGIFQVTVQFWTSRGFAVADVNYGGSSGFGRAYRERLNGRWGEVDVEDCIAAARHLAAEGRVDGSRTVISGGSAGGYTTLCALAFHDVFSAGVSLFGVADLETFARDTHKFEAHYLDTLVGPYPQAAELYAARSPARFADRIRRPLLLLQGLDDEVVPPSQSEQMIEALARNGVAYAYLAFEGEGHGFRRRDSLERVLDAILYFLSRVFEIELPETVEPLEIANLP